MMKPILLVGAMVALAASCGTARRSEPLVGAPSLSADQHRGQLLFMEHCNQCHPGGDAGLALRDQQQAASAAAIKLQVRKGVGQIPAFGPEVIADRDLDPITSYLAAIRKNR